jgi:hypothetical protein
MFLQIMTPVSLMNIAGSDTVFIPGGRSVLCIVTPQLTTIPFMTNQNCDQSSLSENVCFSACLWNYNLFPSTYLTSIWLTSLYFVEVALFILFYNRKINYMNPPFNLLEDVFQPHIWFSTYDQFDLWPGVQKISYLYAREWLSYEK